MGFREIGRLLREAGEHAFVDPSELRKLVGSQVRLTSPRQTEIFDVARDLAGGMSLRSAEREGIGMTVDRSTLRTFTGKEVRLPNTSTMTPVGHVPYRGVPEGMDKFYVEKGLERFINGPGVSDVRGAYAGLESSREIGAVTDAIIHQSKNAEELPFPIYRAMGRFGTSDPNSRLAGVKTANMYELKAGEVFDMAPASFTAAPESKSISDFFKSANMIVEMPSARALSVDHILPGRSNQAEFITSGRMRVKEIKEATGKSPRRMILEHAEQRSSRSSGARNLRSNLNKTQNVYGMTNKF